jgi:hypothetical protein
MHLILPLVNLDFIFHRSHVAYNLSWPFLFQSGTELIHIIHVQQI